MNTLDIIILIGIFILLLIIFVQVNRIQIRSRRIIPYDFKNYSFEIINGPSVEYLLNTNQNSWDMSFGFEVVADSEPKRSFTYPSHNQNRRAISYFIVPNYIHSVVNKQTSQNLYPGLEERNEEFTQQSDKELLINAVIYTQRPTGNYRLVINYNAETRTGVMVIKED